MSRTLCGGWLLEHGNFGGAGRSAQDDDLSRVELDPDPVTGLRRVPERARRFEPGRVLRLQMYGDMGAPEGACGDGAAQPLRHVHQPYARGPHEQRARPLGVSSGTGTFPHGVSASSPLTLASTTLSKPRKRATNSSAGCCHTSSGVPDWAIRPSRITRTRSASAKASPWSCVTASTVVPNSPKSSRSSTTRRSRSERSSWPSGSSSISRRGRGARARASATRCCSPPESAATARCPAPGNPTSSSNSRTRTACSPLLDPCIRSPKATLPPTSRCGKSWWSWNIRPTPRLCAGTPAWSRPSRSTRPASSAWSPATARSSVDLPLPLGPSTHTISCSATARSTASSTARPPKRTVAVSRLSSI